VESTRPTEKHTTQEPCGSGVGRPFLTSRAFGILLAFLVGLVYVLPHMLFIIEAGRDYRHPFLAMPDERHYASRIREVYDGHYAIANPDLKEYKGAPYFWQPLSEILMGGIGKLTGVRLQELLVLADFLFPFLLFMAAYAFGVCVFESRVIAALVACGLMMLSVIVIGPPQMLVHLMGRFPALRLSPLFSVKSSFLFSRSVNPQVNVLLFFLCMSALYGAIFRNPRRWMLPAGILTGLFFYCNFFYWSYVIGGCGIYGLYSLLKKDLRTLRTLVLIVAIAGVVSIPYWIGFLEVRASPFYRDALPRAYFYLSHKPYLAKIEILAVALFLVLCPLKEGPYRFLAAFLVAGLVCENQQIVTGTRMHPYHWSLYCQAPLMWIGLGLMAATAARRWPHSPWILSIRKRAAFWVALVLLFLFVNAVHTQVVYVYAQDREQGPRPFYERSLPTWLYYQKLDDALRWLEHHAQKEAVVLASTDTSDFITMYTPCNVLASWHSHIYLLPGDELWERWLLKFFFFGVPVEKVFSLLVPNLDGLCELCRWRASEEDREALKGWVENRYRALRSQGLETLLAKYDVEYVLVSRAEREEYQIEENGFDVTRYPFLTEVSRTGDIALYRVERGPTR